MDRVQTGSRTVPVLSMFVLGMLILGMLTLTVACQQSGTGGSVSTSNAAEPAAGPGDSDGATGTPSPETPSPETPSPEIPSPETPGRDANEEPASARPAVAESTGRTGNEGSTRSLESTGSEGKKAVVELSDARVRIDERGIFWFGVKYRFVAGQPRKNYLLRVTFPGTQNLCLKHMEAWQLKSEGEIRDGIPLVEQPLKSFEIDFSEAESPMSEYVRISNVISQPYGQSTPTDGTPAAATGNSGSTDPNRTEAASPR